jgi:CheY-like chemotaxis protein
MPVTKKILLIDDDKAVHLTFKNALPRLAQKDYPELILSIDHAMTAETALLKINENPPYDLCIIDYLLVRRYDSRKEIIDSEKACQKIINVLKSCSLDTTIVLHTHYFETDEQIQEVCDRLGMSGYLGKYFIDKLWIDIRKLLFLEDV